jgi:2Fe-2S ferredoxin
MKVKFVPQNVEFEIKPGQSVMHLAEDNGIYVKSVCRGVPSCAECRVKIVEGETNVFAPMGAELGLIGSGWFIDRRRLACQLQCIGDVTVDMSEQIAKQQGLIGGRKAKAAKAIGDRVEDETVIRDSSVSASRDREDDEETEKPRGGSRRDGPREGRREPPPANSIVIGGPKPVQTSAGPAPVIIGKPGPIVTEPRDQGSARIEPVSDSSSGVTEGAQGGGSGQGGGGESRGGRSRRGGRGRR